MEFLKKIFAVLSAMICLFSCYGMNNQQCLLFNEIITKKLTKKQELFCDEIFKKLNKDSLIYDNTALSAMIPSFNNKLMEIKDNFQYLNKLCQQKLSSKEVRENLELISKKINTEEKLYDQLNSLYENIYEILKLKEAQEIFETAEVQSILIWYMCHLRTFLCEKKSGDIAIYQGIIELYYCVGCRLKLINNNLEGLRMVYTYFNNNKDY